MHFVNRFFKTLNINFTNKVQLWHYYKVSNLNFVLNFGCFLESRYCTVLCKSIENKTHMHTFRSCMYPVLIHRVRRVYYRAAFIILELLLNVLWKHFSLTSACICVSCQCHFLRYKKTEVCLDLSWNIKKYIYIVYTY